MSMVSLSSSFWQKTRASVIQSIRFASSLWKGSVLEKGYIDKRTIRCKIPFYEYLIVGNAKIEPERG